MGLLHKLPTNKHLGTAETFQNNNDLRLISKYLSLTHMHIEVLCASMWLHGAPTTHCFLICSRLSKVRPPSPPLKASEILANVPLMEKNELMI